MGTCHTFQYSKKLLADMVTEGVVFGLDPSLSYRIMLHDPNFYLLASNPLVFPRIWVEYKVVQNTIKKITKYKDYYDCQAPIENLQKKLQADTMEPGYFQWLYISSTRHELYPQNEDRQCEVGFAFLNKIINLNTSRNAFRKKILIVWDTLSHFSSAPSRLSPLLNHNKKIS